LSGLKLGFGYTIIGVVVGELLVVNAGMGYLIDWAAFQYFTPELYALIILTISLGIGGHIIFTRIERMWVK
jgi:ABC-type nitrate/sulfonate/bicarbonate transport system permease component